MRDKLVRLPRGSVEIVVRPAQPADLAAMVEIYNHYVLASPATFEVEPLRAEDRRAWMDAHRADGPHRLWAAEVPEGGIVGWASTSSFRPRAAYATTVEASVYVAPASHGRGVGTRLYRALFESIQGEDLERIVAGVTLPNPSSVALHTRFGFRHVGTFSRVGRKFGTFWDVAWFERPLRLEPGSLRGLPAGRPARGAEVRTARERKKGRKGFA